MIIPLPIEIAYQFDLLRIERIEKSANWINLFFAWFRLTDSIVMDDIIRVAYCSTYLTYQCFELRLLLLCVRCVGLEIPIQFILIASQKKKLIERIITSRM